MEQLSRQRGLDIPTADPRVTIQLPAAGEVHLVVSIPAKSGQRSYIEQSIISDVLGKGDFGTAVAGAAPR